MSRSYQGPAAPLVEADMGERQPHGRMWKSNSLSNERYAVRKGYETKAIQWRRSTGRTVARAPSVAYLKMMIRISKGICCVDAWKVLTPFVKRSSVAMLGIFEDTQEKLMF